MKSYTDFNPAVVFLCFACTTGLMMFCTNPVIIAIALAGELAYRVAAGLRFKLSELLFSIALFAVMSLVNPLFNHNGATVLFVMNDNPFTLEALIYGIVVSSMIVTALCRFSGFTHIMTSDKMLYVFGRVSMRIALLLSMTLRFIPLFSSQVKKTSNARKALGISSGDSAIDKLRDGMAVFSVVTTWALENGIVTADSMTARGYGCGKRTSYEIYHFRKSDTILLSAVALTFAGALTGMLCGGLDFSFYPTLDAIPLSPISLITYAAYAFLSFIPANIEMFEALKWSSLKSKI